MQWELYGSQTFSLNHTSNINIVTPTVSWDLVTLWISGEDERWERKQSELIFEQESKWSKTILEGGTYCSATIVSNTANKHICTSTYVYFAHTPPRRVPKQHLRAKLKWSQRKVREENEKEIISQTWVRFQPESLSCKKKRHRLIKAVCLQELTSIRDTRVEQFKALQTDKTT